LAFASRLPQLALASSTGAGIGYAVKQKAAVIQLKIGGDA